MSECQAEPLEGYEHGGPPAEFARLCFKGHVRLGWLCESCAGPADGHGLRRVECGECPPGNGAVLVPIGEWERFLDAEASAAAVLEIQVQYELPPLAPGRLPAPELSAEWRARGHVL